MTNNSGPIILAIDAGNTRIKWGVHEGYIKDGEEGATVIWLKRGALPTGGISQADAFADLPAREINRVIVSNVAGPRVREAIEQRFAGKANSIEFITSCAEQCGVTNRYTDPATLGTDRWAGMIAAHVDSMDVLEPQPQLVVMAGTALTVDALTHDGIFLGGIIVPGLALMRHALNISTAQLPADPGQYQTYPRNTMNAIASGAIEACTGAVQRMYAHLSAQTGETPHCVASGGAIHAMSPHLPFSVTVNDHLVLDGLLAIAKTTATQG